MPPPPVDLSALSEAELRLLEGRERAGLEARVRCLRDVQTLLDAAVVMMEQYSRAAAAAGSVISQPALHWEGRPVCPPHITSPVQPFQLGGS